MSDTDAIANLAALHALQNGTSMMFRHEVAKALAHGINTALGEAGSYRSPGPDVDAAALELHSEGRLHFGQILDATKIAAIVDHFRSRPCYNAHVNGMSDGIPRRLGGEAEQHHYGSYSRRDVLDAPHLLELANHPNIIALAHSYLGCLPTLYSLHAWWSFAGHGKARFSQEFHRDRDDFRFCTLFIYLTDVAAKNSPHVFIRRSHRPDLIHGILRGAADRLQRAGIATSVEDLYRNQEGYGRDDLYQAVFADYMETIEGPAGTAFLADTSGLHKGVPPVEGNRLMAWARYGIYRNDSSRGEEFQPLPDAGLRARLPSGWRFAYINRTLVAPAEERR